MRRITQKDIAQRLNISRPLVSLALSGFPHVSQVTRELVRKTADEMGYFVDIAARKLAVRRSGRNEIENIIAVIVPAFLDSSEQGGSGLKIRNQPYFAAYINGIEETAERHGIDILYSILRRKVSLPRIVLNGDIDGIILLGECSQLSAGTTLMRVPSISMGFEQSGASWIMPDEEAGSRKVVTYLLRHGHRRIGYLGHHLQPGLSLNLQRRFAGYISALSTEGISPSTEWIETIWEQEVEKAREAAVRLLVRAPELTAIVCYNDFHAMGAVLGAREVGRNCPKDISITGFDDLSSEYDFNPAITSISFDRNAMGRMAVDWVIERRGTKSPGNNGKQRLMINTDIAEHGSVSSAPV